MRLDWWAGTGWVSLSQLELPWAWCCPAPIPGGPRMWQARLCDLPPRRWEENWLQKEKHSVQECMHNLWRGQEGWKGWKEQFHAGVYVEESSRSTYERAKEHEADKNRKAEESHQVKHWLTSHEELLAPPKFKFNVVRTFQDPLTRQLSEAVRIELRGDEILNSKAEYSRWWVSRLRVDLEVLKDKKKEKEKKQEGRKAPQDQASNFQQLSANRKKRKHCQRGWRTIKEESGRNNARGPEIKEKENGLSGRHGRRGNTGMQGRNTY